MRFSWRCGCRTTSARSSPKARSTPRSFRPMRASASPAAPTRCGCSATAFSRCCWRARSCCSAWRCCSRRWVIDLLAPGFSKDPGRFALAVDLTRITFPYLLLVSLVTLYGGILNALDRFAAAAAAPILLNLSMMMTLGAGGVFPDRRACRGLGRAARRDFWSSCWSAAMPRGRACCRGFAWPRIDQEVMLFLKRFGPATIGSAGTQIALFADTIIASFLATGALSALYYADRLNQLPIGVIGIAAGTVLLPEMARRITAGDEAGARPFAKPRDRADAAAVGAVPRGVPDRAGFDHARAVRPRRLHRGRCPCRRVDADGLCHRASAVRADAERDGDIPVARRHHDAGQGAVRRGRGERAAENPADGSLRPGRARLRDLGRRLDQSGAAGLVFGAPEFPRHRSRACGDRAPSSPSPA